MSIGRIGLMHPNLVAPALPEFAQAWCQALYEIRDNEEKDSAFRGLCTLVQVNPLGIAKVSFIAFYFHRPSGWIHACSVYSNSPYPMTWRSGDYLWCRAPAVYAQRARGACNFSSVDIFELTMFPEFAVVLQRHRAMEPTLSGAEQYVPKSADRVQATRRSWLAGPGCNIPSRHSGASCSTLWGMTIKYIPIVVPSLCPDNCLCVCSIC